MTVVVNDRNSSSLAAGVLAVLLAGCFKPVPPPPVLGYGDPYRGNGQTIFVKDSRDDWDITEGAQKISAEQALEASGDVEYEQRRQQMKAYNAQLEREGKRNRRRGTIMTAAGIGAIVLGMIVSYAIAPNMTSDSRTAATATAPEMLETGNKGSGYTGMYFLGGAMLYGGGAAAVYALIFARKDPPYRAWRVPDALNRPAYIRRATEDYNAKLEKAAPRSAPSEARPPGELRPPPIKRTPNKSFPRPRGGRR